MSQSYELRGRVEGFGGDSLTVFINHEQIPAVMPSMTMPFRAGSATTISGLRHGDEVAFVLYVADGTTWIDEIRLLTDSDLPLDLPGESIPHEDYAPSPYLAPGDPLPGVDLIDQDGNAFLLSEFQGSIVVMTFIYTRCPLPDYCPLMSERMSALQKSLTERYPGNVQLVSITIDPAYDTPEILSEYASRYTADTTTWRFATGAPETILRLSEALGIASMRDGATIDHSLATAIVGTDGSLSAVWRGNQWSTDEVSARVELLLADR